MTPFDPHHTDFFIQNADKFVQQIKKRKKSDLTLLTTYLTNDLKERIEALKQEKSQDIQAALDDLMREKISSKKWIKIREYVLAKLSVKEGTDDKLIEEINRLPAALSAYSSFEETPLRQHPVFKYQVNVAIIRKVGKWSGCTEDQISGILESGVTYKTLNEPNLKPLLKKKFITKEHAQSLQFASELLELLDEDAQLTFVIIDHKRLEADRIKDLSDLCSYSLEDWQEILADSQLFKGNKNDKAASRVYKKVARRFPERSLAIRLNGYKDSKALKWTQMIDYDRVAKADFQFKRNLPKQLAKQLSKIKNKVQQDQIFEAHRLIHSFPWLEMEDHLNNAKEDKKVKGKKIEKRLSEFLDFLDQNQQVNFLSIDYSPPIDGEKNGIDRLDFKGVEEREKPLFLKTLRAYQRLFTLDQDLDIFFLLLSHGYQSAVEVSEIDLNWLIKKANISKEKAESIRSRAQWIANASSSVLGSITEFVNYKDRLRFLFGPSKQVYEYLENLVGYEALFGRQEDYCKCKECQSIISPAAYFVDLLKFIEDRVLNLSNVSAAHEMHLEKRRPDLWKLPLTCENTNNKISFLTISNEVLENYIAVKEGFDSVNLYRPSGDALYSQGRTDIENLVYTTLSTNTNNINQPFVLPVAEIHTFLQHYNQEVSLYDIAISFKEPREVLIRTYFKTSDGYLVAVYTAQSIVYLRTLFDYNFSITSGFIDPVDVQVFIKALDISREEFGSLIRTKYISPSFAEQVVIVPDKLDQVNDVQFNVEYVKELTTSKLDRIHRLARLSKVSGFPFQEIDSVIIALIAAGLIDAANPISDDWTNIAGVTQPGLTYYLMLLDQYRKAFNTTYEELIPIIHHLSESTTNSSRALLDELFNHEQFVSMGGALPDTASTFTHPNFNNAYISTDETLQRLIAGLKVSSTELFKLINHLGPVLSPDGNGGIVLSLENLSLLYRHTFIAAKLSLSIDELFKLISLSGSGNNYVTGLPDFQALLHFHEWLVNQFGTYIRFGDSAITVYEAIVTNDLLMLDEHCQPDLILSGLVQNVQADDAFVFVDSEFASIDEVAISEEESIDLVASNPNIFIPVDGGYELADNYDSSSFTWPATGWTSAKQAALISYLENFHISSLFPRYLANQLDTYVELVNELLKFTSINYSNSNYVKELKGDNSTSDLLAIIANMIPWFLLLDGENTTSSLVKFICDQPSPLYFELQDSAGNPDYLLRPDRIRRIIDYKSFFPTESDGYSDQELIRLLSNFTSANKFLTSGNPNDLDILEKVIGERTIMTDVLKAELPANAIDALVKLSELQRKASLLSLTIDQLKPMTSTTFGDLREASLALISSFRNKYKEESQFQERIRPFIDRINELRRDALISYLLRNANLGFETSSQLYAHFLLDVEMSGCAETSRVVAAISSLQLYMQRCLMSLEIESPMVFIQVEDQVKKEWEWRKNFRVWQANRQVYLYPENYIEPDLRLNKTPLFRQLEEELLQQEINKQNVQDAYTKYMNGFEEVSRIKIVGAYVESLDLQDFTTYFVGVTESEPIQYYYRRTEKINNVDNLLWTPWEKIDIEIPVHKIAPVVLGQRLFIFWAEFNSYAENEFDGGDQTFPGYRHRVRIKFSHLRMDKTWSTPQELQLRDIPSDSDIFDGAADGIIKDPLVNPDSLRRPTFGYEIHQKPKEGYTLRGFHWEQLFPDIATGGVSGNRIAFAGAAWSLWQSVSLQDLATRNLPSTVDFDSMAFRSSFAGYDFFTYRSNIAGNEDRRNKGLDLRKSSSPFTYHKRELFLDESRKDTAVNHNVDIAGIVENEVPAAERPDLRITVDYNKVDKEPWFVALNGVKNGAVINTEIGSYTIQAKGNSLFEPEVQYVLSRLNSTAVDEIQTHLVTGGFEKMLSKENQDLTEHNPINFTPNPLLVNEIGITLDYTGPMGTYFREIYFHIPFLIANHLNSQQKFQEAQHWYHYIFNPTANPMLAETDTVDVHSEKLKNHIWQYQEFIGEQIPTLRAILSDDSQIEIYKRNPFDPHAIAHLRISAYQKAIVMKYLDNLIEWGDFLFTQDTTESINEATMLYTMASDILGEKPKELGSCGAGMPDPLNYETIQDRATFHSDFLIELENLVINLGIETGRASGEKPPPSASIVRDVPLFCIPTNKKLLGYWKRVEGRLKKIRNCQNISGIRRSLSLFQPPIDPALLVRAVSQGLSLSDVINSLSTGPSSYRFEYLISFVKSQTNTLQQFGGLLLSAIEKKDVEELNKLRVIHEQNILSLTKSVHDKEIEAANENIESLERRKELVRARLDHYTLLITNGVNPFENTQREAQKESFRHRSKSQMMGMAASLGHMTPQLGAPTAITFGGIQIGASLSAWSGYYAFQANEKDATAASAGIEGGYARREEEWTLQKDLAEKEITQIEKDLSIAKIRLEIAEENKKINQQNLDQNKEILEFYRDKFTNLKLYSLISRSVQAMYKEFYNLTLKLAKQAELSYHFELEDSDSYVKPTYWNQQHSGLLAGEKLMVDLQRLENAYLEKNKRRIEITQHFSLNRISPASLLSLKLTGECDFDIPEIYFDLLYPGHYRRRIKSVRITIPSIAGPYTNISAQLTITKSEIRNQPDPTIALTEMAMQQTLPIATSSAQNDSGQFQLSFSDNQYAPFEGNGSISSWTLKLPAHFRSFDYKSISDVIVHMDYTAAYDEGLRSLIDDDDQSNTESLKSILTDDDTTLNRLLNFKFDFGNEFHQLLSSPTDTEVTLPVTMNYFPLFFNESNIKIKSVELILETKKRRYSNALTLELNDVSFSLSDGNEIERLIVDVTSAFTNQIIKAHKMVIKNVGDLGDAAGKLDPKKLINIYLLIDYRMLRQGE